MIGVLVDEVEGDVSGVEWFINQIFARIPCKKPSVERARQVQLIAHRGAHEANEAIVENTDEAFAKALALNCWGIEFDVHATADHVIVVNHDPTLTRLWQQDQTIRNLSFAQLRQLVPSIPTLNEVIDRYAKHLHLFIELKAPFQDESALIDCLKDLQACRDYHLLSLHESTFTQITAFPKEALLLVPEQYNVEKFCRASLQKRYGGVLGHYLLLTDSKIKRLTGAGQRVGVGFVDSKNSLYREINRGLDWIFTNNAKEVSGYLQELIVN